MSLFLERMMSIRDCIDDEKKSVLQRRKQGTFRNTSGPYRTSLVIFLGIVNLTLGLILLFTYVNLTQISIPYSTGITTAPLEITKSAEYKMYIEVGSFNQNFLNYSRSISNSQLKGEATTDLSSCNPLETENGKIIYPCGLIANSFLQDSFTIVGKDISTKGISWGSESNRVKPTKYRFDDITAPPLWEPYTQIPDLQNNERFTNWISIGPFDTFRKLYGKVFLESGTYDFIVNSNYPFGNTKVVFAQTSWAGVRNMFLAIALIFCGFMMVVGFGVLLKFADHREETEY